MSTESIVDSLMLVAIPEAVDLEKNTSFDSSGKPCLVMTVNETALFLEDIVNGVLNRVSIKD